MADRGLPYPTVFSVDSCIGVPPLPPKPGQRMAQRQRRKVTETILFLLVSMALIGILVEACFLYYLQSHKQDVKDKEFHHLKSKQPDTPDTPQTDAQKGDKRIDEPVMPQQPTVRPTRRPTFRRPSKSVAHLQRASWPDKDGLITWSDEEDHIHELTLTNGKLVVPKEGYYYIYSKLTFKADGGTFNHRVMKATHLYPDPIELLRYHYVGGQKPNLTSSVRNSYLGGVFHLFRKEGVFVQAKDGRVLLQSAGENFFGMFMV
ncbi:tumor necrosis factor ligand superfamily member 14 [Astyanax mexicanus]|uniref:Tumor necrosis factor ligand superfamily member 14-like n=1 Tax=Astyanax mexicanus TaxID=7994 RepID=A0A3B1J6I6_ASTMX|nr:tumor necrosis factor ligand superfamily member 14 [Astyanax mexicanus]